MLKSDMEVLERYWHTTIIPGQVATDDIKVQASKKLLQDLSENVKDIRIYHKWLQTACNHKMGIASFI